jgi:glycosyltransferase involved in cell wall biosynthesis
MTDSKTQKQILCFRGDRSACHFFRIFCPFGKLAQHHKDNYSVFVSSAITQDHLKGSYDLILLQRQYKADVLKPILEMKKKGPKLVYEIDDDLFNIPDWNPAKAILGVRSVQDGIKKFLEIVDAAFVSTEYLVDIYKPYCKKVYVLPNSINYDFVYPKVANAAKKVVLWQGSMTHHKDIGVAEKSIAALAKNQDIVVKMWCGFDPKTYKPIFDFPGAQTIPLVPFEAFYAMFSQVDAHVGLAPLSAVPFNRSKSNLKFLEYTVQGLVTIASDFGPYRETMENDQTGILVSDNRDWYDAVMDILKDDDKRNRILTNAQELVKEKYDIEKNYLLWKNAIDELLGVHNE